MKFNEDFGVKIPAFLHLAQMGCGQVVLKDLEWDPASQIVPSLFRKVLAYPPSNSKPKNATRSATDSCQC